jgi:hypothetical protein
MPEENPFDPEGFFERLNRGEFDGHLLEEVSKLSPEEIEQLAAVLVRRMKGESTTR